MGDVVNLNKFRKRKAAEEKQQQADANRRKHGRTKGERTHESVEQERLDQLLEGAKLEGPPEEPGDGT